MRHFLPRVFARLVRGVGRALLRAVVTGLIFATCLLFTLSSLGVPLPDPGELLEQFGSVSQLSKILS